MGTGRSLGTRRGGACARALVAGAPPLGRHVGWRVGVKRCTGSSRSRLFGVAGDCSLALARPGNGGHGFQLLGPEALPEEMTVERLSVLSALPALKLRRVQA
ncbi:hypothetical protein HispidOSU_022572 [Sigmodon hispidus]